MKKLTSGILVSAALLAVSAPMVTNATTVLADTSTSEATMVTVTITNIDTKGNILSSQQHQVKQGSNVDAYPFWGDIYTGSIKPGTYGPVVSANQTYKKVQSGQVLKFVFGKKLNAQFIYVDTQGNEIKKDVTGKEVKPVNATEFETNIISNLTPPEGYTFASRTAQHDLSQPANLPRGFFTGITTEGPFKVALVKLLTVPITYKNLNGKVLGTQNLQIPINESINTAQSGYLQMPNNTIAVAASQQPNGKYPYDYVFKDESPVTFTVVNIGYDDFDGVATVASETASLFSDKYLTESLNRKLNKGTSWHVYGVQRTGTTDMAYDLGGSQWISARDVLIAGTNQPAQPSNTAKETPMSGVFTVKVPKHPTWSTVLWDKDGKSTGRFLKTNSSWKILAKKTINGKTFYRLGNQNQWVDASYGTVK